MISTGIDILEIGRLNRSIKNDRFVRRVFGENERREFLTRGLNPQTAASAFSAKEAFSKALGTGIRGFRLVDVELLHDDNGRPYLFLSGEAKEMADERGFDFSVSISHTKDLVTAIVIAYDKD